MTRVLHVIGGLAAINGGPSWSVPALCRGLAAAGLEVEVATPEGPAEVGLPAGVRALAATGVPLLALPSGGGALHAVIARQRLVHVHGAWRPFVHRVHAAARRLGVPIVSSLHGTLEPWALRHKRVKKLAGWHLYQRRDVWAATALHATAERERQSLLRLGVPNPVAVIPNPVEIPTLSDLPERPRAAERRHRVLFLSRIHSVKGLDLLLEAWSRVRPPAWELIIAGTGEPDYCARLEEQVRRLGLAGEVSFPGHVEGAAKWALYRGSDLFVLPSRSENFGLVVAEALAAETPAISTDAAPWDQLPRLGCGWCVPVSVEAIATALAEAVGVTDEVRTAMGAKGRRFVEASFSVESVARQTQELYRWVLGETADVPAFVHLPARGRSRRGSGLAR